MWLASKKSAPPPPLKVVPLLPSWATKECTGEIQSTAYDDQAAATNNPFMLNSREEASRKPYGRQHWQIDTIERSDRGYNIFNKYCFQVIIKYMESATDPLMKHTIPLTWWHLNVDRHVDGCSAICSYTYIDTAVVRRKISNADYGSHAILTRSDLEVRVIGTGEGPIILKPCDYRRRNSIDMTQ